MIVDGKWVGPVEHRESEPSTPLVLVLAGDRLFVDALAQAFSAGGGPRVVTEETSPLAEPVDVVLIDADRPVAELEELLEECTRRQPEASVVLLTARPPTGRSTRPANGGAAAWVSRHDDVSTVCATLLAVGQSEQPRRAARGDHLRTFPPTIPLLTPREIDVLRSLAAGRDKEEVSRDLAISVNTVRTHLQNIFGKLGVQSQHAAVTAGRRQGLLPPPSTLRRRAGR